MGHSWTDWPMIFTLDFVIRENLLADRLTRDPKSLFTRSNSCIILYIIASDNSLSPDRHQAII